MIKILHSADWHLDSPMSGHSPESAEFLRREMGRIPEKIAALAKEENCDLMLLAGDLFEGTALPETVRSVQKALSQAGMPVFISPGNHDHLCPGSPYEMAGWPENVHIFKEPGIQSVSLPELDCKIYGAGYTAIDCPALLKGFQAEGQEQYHIGILHGEADTARSSYCPISKEQLRSSALTYLALGHIHKGGSTRGGETLCAWPGCPMGHGYDELGEKGALIVTLDDGVDISFRPLDGPRFYDEDLEAGNDPLSSLRAFLPSLPTEDFYRITLTGYNAGVDVASLYSAFPHIRNLTLRDETLPEMDLWQAAGEDSLEGVVFSLLQQAAQSDNPALQNNAQLAARICRQILDGQEVKLP